MSKITSIQWADTTVNPIMGCGGCELFPQTKEVLGAINTAVAATGTKIDSSAVFKVLVGECFSKIKNPVAGHKNAVNTTNIWHLRDRFADEIGRVHGKPAATAAAGAIRQAITCYAATLHLNKGLSIVNPTRTPHKGYAPTFENVTQFGGRVADTAELPDLLGRFDCGSPWKSGLPRMIFVSDMGDALSAKGDFPFLKNDVMPAIQSGHGQRHLWLWLTKRPERMAEFANGIGGFPANVCAMTTVTGPDKLERIDQLRQVQASVRGLSIEPLWERIPPKKLNLTGIDWVIVGGESGAGDLTRPFALEWAEELREHCRKKGVAFFLKQLGRNPSRNGEVFRLKDKHGGEWNEWDESMRIREFPPYFHQYRTGQICQTREPRRKPKITSLTGDVSSPVEKADFKRLDEIVRQGVAAFMEAGKALAEIHERKLWKAGGHLTWETYCREVAGMSKPHAHRLVEASRIAMELAESLPIGNDLPQTIPVSESQVRPLQRLEDATTRRKVWESAVEKAGGQPTAREVIEAVVEFLEPEKPPENRVTRTQQRTQLFVRLKAVIHKRNSWDDVERLLQELEELL